MNIEYGFYKLDAEFLTRAHNTNNNVLTETVYLGPVKEITTKRGTAALFVPFVDTPNTSVTPLKNLVENGIYCNLKFNAMLPVISKKLLTPAGDAIDDETRHFYMTHRTTIEKMANAEYDRHR